MTRRLTAIVRDEDLPDEARAAPRQHVILKLNLGGGHCDHEGMEQGRECQVGLDRGKSGSREQGSEVRGIGRAQGFGRSLSGDDDRRSGVDDRRLRVPVLLLTGDPGQGRGALVSMTRSKLVSPRHTRQRVHGVRRSACQSPAFYRPHRLASRSVPRWMPRVDERPRSVPSFRAVGFVRNSVTTPVCETKLGRSTHRGSKQKRSVE